MKRSAETQPLAVALSPLCPGRGAAGRLGVEGQIGEGGLDSSQLGVTDVGSSFYELNK